MKDPGTSADHISSRLQRKPTMLVPRSLHFKFHCLPLPPPPPPSFCISLLQHTLRARFNVHLRHRNVRFASFLHKTRESLRRYDLFVIDTFLDSFGLSCDLSFCFRRGNDQTPRIQYVLSLVTNASWKPGRSLKRRFSRSDARTFNLIFGPIQGQVRTTKQFFR